MNVAAGQGHAGVCELLLRRGANHEPDASGRTPLGSAAYEGHAEVCKLLVEHGAAHEADMDGNTPMLCAAFGNHAQVCQVLIDASRILSLRRESAGLDEPNRFGWSPVLMASRHGNAEALSVLLRAGFSTARFKQPEGYSPLWLATISNNLSACSVLIKHATEIAEEGDESSLAAINDPFSWAKITPLYVAARRGNAEMCELFLRSGAARHIPDVDGCTPLFMAAQLGDDRTCEILLDHEATHDPRKTGFTPLHVAAQLGHASTCELLLRRGATHAPDADGQTPLASAAFNNHLDVCRLLLEHGRAAHKPDKSGALHAPDSNGNTPLLCAAFKNHADMCTLLLEGGADPHAANHKGWTPLVMAAFNGNEQATERLLLADDRDKSQALWYAASNGQLHICRQLVERGADIRVQNTMAISVRDIARMQGHAHVCRYLDENDARCSQTHERESTRIAVPCS